MPLRHRVFVYGTLRKGGSNHGLLRCSRRLGCHRTEAGFRMLHMGGYPGVVTGGEDLITGEVYEVTPRVLRWLDRLEDHPRTYRRVPIATPWGDAWIYLYQRDHGRYPRITTGDWFRRISS